MFRLIAAVAVIGFSAVAFASVEQKAAAFVLCKNKKDVRTIRVLNKTNSGGCLTTYSKGQVEEVVGEGRTLNGCQSILKNIQTNLENARWSCRTVETARVMMSSEVVQ